MSGGAPATSMATTRAVDTMGYTRSGDIPHKLKRAFQAWDNTKTAAE